MAKAKVLLFDIETFPNLGWTWGKWQQDVIKFKKHWEMASFAYKWLGEKEITCFSRRNMSEKELVKQLYQLMNEADIVIAHNGDQFDIKKARAKFIKYRFKPSVLNKSVDTKKIAKSQFGFTSNSLDDLADYLGIGRKIQTGGKELWFACMDNVPAAWDRMEKYNKHDVVLLEKVYLLFRSWMPNHPNLAALEDRAGCATCASTRIQYRGVTPTPKNKRRRFVCLDCGKWDTAPVGKKAA